MTFPWSIYFGTLAVATIAAGLSHAFWEHAAARFGLLDEPGPRKIHARIIPLSGGLTVLTGLLLPLAGGAVWVWLSLGEQPYQDLLRYGFSRRGLQILVILGGAVLMFLLGFLDDRVELRPGWKFAGQIAVALITAAAGLRVTLFIPSIAFSYFITVLWIVTITNAFNFIDNMNGLCSGLALISAFFFALAAALQGQYLVALLAFAVCGAFLGFLPYNFPNARAFLGDAGSHLAGYLMGVLAILPHFYSEQSPIGWAVVSPLFILAVPLADMVWVIFYRTAKRKPFYIGDTNHFSHRLVRSGFSRTQTVLLLWLGSAVCGALPFLLF